MSESRQATEAAFGALRSELEMADYHVKMARRVVDGKLRHDASPMTTLKGLLRRLERRTSP